MNLDEVSADPKSLWWEKIRRRTRSKRSERERSERGTEEKSLSVTLTSDQYNMSTVRRKRLNPNRYQPEATTATAGRDRITSITEGEGREEAWRNNPPRVIPALRVEPAPRAKARMSPAASKRAQSLETRHRALISRGLSGQSVGSFGTVVSVQPEARQPPLAKPVQLGTVIKPSSFHSVASRPGADNESHHVGMCRSQRYDCTTNIYSYVASNSPNENRSPDRRPCATFIKRPQTGRRPIVANLPVAVIPATDGGNLHGTAVRGLSLQARLHMQRETRPELRPGGRTDLRRDLRIDPRTTTTTEPIPSTDLRKRGERRKASSSFRNESYSWKRAIGLIERYTFEQTFFKVNDSYMHSWDLQALETLGSAANNGRVQRMWRGTAVNPRTGSEQGVFIKQMPIAVWNKQYEAMEDYMGEWVTDGENFVMEAAVGVSLTESILSISPDLLGIVKCFGRPDALLPSGSPTKYIAIVTKLYGKDTLDFFQRELSIGGLEMPRAMSFHYEVVEVMMKLHEFGLCHLDFTPENILIGSEGVKMVDFAKATVIKTYNKRHKPPNNPSKRTVYRFQSCEPTVGKTAYMPPECWKAYWQLETERIYKPLACFEDAAYHSHDARRDYYFYADKADMFMLGVFCFWLASGGNLWKSSDPRQDEMFRKMAVHNRWSLNGVKPCETWPRSLKKWIAGLLAMKPSDRVSFQDMRDMEWSRRIKRQRLRDSNSLFVQHGKI